MKPLCPSLLGVLTTATILTTAHVYGAREETRRSVPADARSAAAYTDLSRDVHLASIYAEDRSLRHYAGQKLANHEGAELGEIRDFIVDPSTGRLRYAVVSTGGVLGMGNVLRLVPAEVLRFNQTDRRLTAPILHGRWLQIPPVSDQDYVADRFTIAPAQHTQWVDTYDADRTGGRVDRPASRDAARNDRYDRTATRSDARVTPSVAGTSETVARLVRASTLRGKKVHTEGQHVGNIENIILDLEHLTAAALLDTSAGRYTGTSAKYLVPLSRLGLHGTPEDRISTTLTRRDFDGARPSDFGRTVDSASVPARADQPRR